MSIARAIGPALSTSLFSFSVEKNILGGSGVYVAFATLSGFAIYLATRLPPKPWDEHGPISSISIQNFVERALPLKSRTSSNHTASNSRYQKLKNQATNRITTSFD